MRADSMNRKNELASTGVAVVGFWFARIFATSAALLMASRYSPALVRTCNSTVSSMAVTPSTVTVPVNCSGWKCVCR